MDQIRFDFLSSQAITALNRNVPTPSDPSDAFSQVLDQQLKTPGIHRLIVNTGEQQFVPDE